VIARPGSMFQAEMEVVAIAQHRGRSTRMRCGGPERVAGDDLGTRKEEARKVKVRPIFLVSHNNNC